MLGVWLVLGEVDKNTTKQEGYPKGLEPLTKMVKASEYPSL